LPVAWSIHRGTMLRAAYRAAIVVLCEPRAVMYTIALNRATEHAPNIARIIAGG
jgi:hypothetical protein